MTDTDVATKAVIDLVSADETAEAKMSELEEVNKDEKSDDEEEDEDEDDEEAKRLREEAAKSQQRWAALIASASAEFELDETPLDVAVKDLKVGNLMRKLTVVRALPETIRTEGQTAIERLLPAIQEALLDDASLDLHAEAVATFQIIIRNRQLTSLYTELNNKLLNLIFQFIDVHVDCLSGTAWFESLLEICTYFPVKTVIDLFIPITISRAEPNRKSQLRSISARLVEKLCEIVPADSVRKNLAPCTQMLSHDDSSKVRLEVAQRLSVIARSLNNASDCVSLLLPCLIELCKDEDVSVRGAILNTIVLCLPYLTKESRKSVVVPLLKKCSEQAIFLHDATLQVVARHLGGWLEALHDLLSSQEERWFLDMYSRLVDLCSGKDSLLFLGCRRMCAYNFPCFVKFYHKDQFYEKLMPIFKEFCSDTDEEVRGTVGAGFHEIVRLRPDDPSLLMPFIELIRSGAADVVQHLTSNLNQVLPPLYDCLKKGNSQNVTRIQLDRILLGCNRLIRSTGAWRFHEAYLSNMAVMRTLIPTNDLFVSFVPLFKQEVLTARAIPCRVAAIRTLLLIMRELPLDKNRQEIVNFFNETIAYHESCQRRRLLVEANSIVLKHFSRDFFIQNFFPTVLEKINDPVWNIRLQVCKFFAEIKQFMVYPANEKEISQMEQAVRELLKENTTTYNQQIIQQYARELARAETATETKLDEEKFAQEKKLWTNIEAIETILAANQPPPVPPKPKNNLMRRFSTGKATGLPVSKPGPPVPPRKAASQAPETEHEEEEELVQIEKETQAWKTSRPEKPKMAIVRPQPQVTLTHRSPSPMPMQKGSTDDLRKSKLPLSTNSYRSSSVNTNPSPLNSPTTRQASPSITNARDLTKYRPRTVDASRKPPMLRRSATASNALSGISGSIGGSNIMSRSTDASGLMSSRSMSSVRRPYSLMKVQSTSSVDRKPGHMSIRVTSMS